MHIKFIDKSNFYFLSPLADMLRISAFSNRVPSSFKEYIHS